MRRVLYINGVKVLTIELEASPEMVETEEGEKYPIGDFLENTIESNIELEGISKIKTEWKTEGLFDKIKSDPKLLRKFRRQFLRALNSNGEEMIGEYKTKEIIERFEHQGFWSGVACNIFYHGEGIFFAIRRYFGK